MSSRGLLLIALALSSGCTDTEQDRVSVPLYVAGVDVSEPFMAVGDVAVTLERAELAFGPLYLCAGATAGDLCDTARLEWLDAVVVDTTSPIPVRAGELAGVTGPVRSWMYDLGISSQLTRSEPFVLDAARQLGDVSFRVEGWAHVRGARVPFSAAVPVQQTATTELGVPVVRKSTSESFAREVTADDLGLVVRFDPGSWIRSIDFRSYVEDEACLNGAACEAWTLTPDSEAFRSLHNALVSGARPAFEWNYVP
jgi:hypothetical protein